MDQSMNKMGTAPIGKIMLAMGTPMIFSMVLQAFYNIVDSYFVSAMPDTAEITAVGEYGMNALTLSFPIQMLMIAIGVGTGVGINALLSRSLGENNKEKASKIAGNAIFLGACTYLIFLLFGVFGVKPYLLTQTSDPVVLAMGVEYLQICTVLSFSVILFMIYEKLLQSTGRTMLSTIAQVAGALTNIVLDPIMIFGFGGCPAMGVAGAAYATVIGQTVSLVISAFFHYRYNSEVTHKLSYFKPDTAIIKVIYGIGIPAIIMQALMSFMTYGANVILGQISSAVVTAYGVYYKIQQFILFAAFGMNNALIPIISFNYGLKNKKRLLEGIHYGMVYTCILMGIGSIAFIAAAKPIASIFSLTEETELLCIQALHIIPFGYLFIGANVTFQGIFQALGSGINSLIISFVRLILIPLPAAYILIHLFHAEHVIWWVFPLGEAVALFLALYLYYFHEKNRIASLRQEQAGWIQQPE